MKYIAPYAIARGRARGRVERITLDKGVARSCLYENIFHKSLKQYLQLHTTEAKSSHSELGSGRRSKISMEFSQICTELVGFKVIGVSRGHFPQDNRPSLN